MIEIVEDHFVWNADRRQLQLDEPDTLLGDRVARTRVHEYRIAQGWQLMTTLYNEDHLDLVDLWSRTGLPPEKDPIESLS